MDYQNFRNRQLRPLRKNFFHNIQLDLRDTSGEKTHFVSVGITRLLLMFENASDVQF